MRPLILRLIALSLVVGSCREPYEPPIIVTSPREYTAIYRLSDSTWHYSHDTPKKEDTIIHTELNRTVSIYMDSALNYITIATDTFRYLPASATYGYPGYYSSFSSPAENTKLVLTTDSLKRISVWYQGNNTAQFVNTVVGYNLH